MADKNEAPEISKLNPEPQQRKLPQLIYMNDFLINGTLSEVSLTLIADNRPVINGVLVMNLSVAKELADQLSQTIEDTENILQREILSTSDAMERREAFRVREVQNKIFKKSVDVEIKGDPKEVTLHGAIYYENVWLDCDACKVSTKFERVPKAVPVKLKCCNPQCTSFKEVCMGGK